MACAAPRPDPAFFGADAEARWIGFDVLLAAEAPEVRFGGTKEGSFGLRIAESMRADRKARRMCRTEGERLHHLGLLLKNRVELQRRDVQATAVDDLAGPAREEQTAVRHISDVSGVDPPLYVEDPLACGEKPPAATDTS